MANQAQMLITWTPSPDATAQQVLRSTTSNGPWTTIATLSASSSSYTDVTVDPTPFTTYYYKIKTICSSGNIDTPVDSDICQNCPTSGNTFIFGGRNKATTQTYADFSWTSGPNKWINSNYGTSLPTTGGYSGLSNDGTSSPNKFLFCAECGKDVNISVNPFTGGTLNSDFSYMENQGHIASHLPTPPIGLGGSTNNNLGNVKRKVQSAGAFAAPDPGRFQLGIGNVSSSSFLPWYGGYVNNNTNVNGVPGSGFSWNFDRMPSNNGTNQGGFTQIRIDKRIWNGSSASGDQSTAIGGLIGNNVYISIIDEAYTGTGTNGQTAYYGGALRCEHHLYKLTRKSSLDTTNSIGFTMLKQAQLTNGDTVIRTATHNNAFRPYSYNQQTTAYLKIFTL